MIPGRATEAGTAAYAARFADAAEGHFRQIPELCVSSIGIGTGGVTPEEGVAKRATQAMEAALCGGLNVIDTADSYGHGAAEAAVGAALERLLGRGRLRREEIVLCSKVGYLVEPTTDHARSLIAAGVCDPSDFARSAHCIARGYVGRQIEASRRRMGVDTIDVLLLHNPEDQLVEVGRREFERRMRAAFEALEEAVVTGAIGRYGIATAEGLRSGGKSFHELGPLVRLAEEVGGADHRFRIVELPLNVVASEALFVRNHRIGDRSATALDVADELGIAVLASLALNRGRLPSPMPAALRDASPDLTDASQLALQFTRSCPGVAVALVGMTAPAHVEANLELVRVPPVDLLAEHRPAGAA